MNSLCWSKILMCPANLITVCNIIIWSLMNCCVFEQLQFSEVLVKWRQFFNFLAAQQGKSDMMVLEQKLELEQLKVRLTFSKFNAACPCMFTHNCCPQITFYLFLRCSSLHDFRCRVFWSAAMYAFNHWTVSFCRKVWLRWVLEPRMT